MWWLFIGHTFLSFSHTMKKMMNMIWLLVIILYILCTVLAHVNFAILNTVKNTCKYNNTVCGALVSSLKQHDTLYYYSVDIVLAHEMLLIIKTFLYRHKKSIFWYSALLCIVNCVLCYYTVRPKYYLSENTWWRKNY